MAEQARFGEIIRAWRAHRGLTGSELAALIGSTKAYVSQVETGRVARPSEERVRQFAQALDLPLDVLLLRLFPEEIERPAPPLPFGGAWHFPTPTQDPVDTLAARIRSLMVTLSDDALEAEIQMLLDYIAWREYVQQRARFGSK